MSAVLPDYRPLLALIELTLRCNLRCLHCGSTAGGARAGELDEAELGQVLHELAELGCREVVLLGGEPLLHPAWARLVGEARALGLAPILITNGLLVDDATARRLAALGVDRVGVSIDGARPETHDALRGAAGAHARAWAAIERLRSAGVTCSLITTVSRRNAGELGALRDQIRGRGVGWQIQTVSPDGARFAPADRLSPAEFYAVAAFIAECRATIPLAELPVAGSHDFGYHSARLRNIAQRPEWPGCLGGISTVGVQSDGLIKPCLSLPPRFAEGSARAPGLRAVWRDPERFTRNRRFRADSLRGGCRGCAHGATCRAGCPDVAQSATGDDLDNPYCLHRIERDASA
jgi:radical SAM protein with 4Fe4S-binding SPASM domain